MLPLLLLPQSKLFPTLPQLSPRFQPPLLFPTTTLPLLLSPPTILPLLLSPTTTLPTLLSPPTILPLLLSPTTTLPPLLSPPTTPFLTPATLAPTLDTLASLDTTGTSLPREKLKPKLMHTLQPRLLMVFLMPMLWLLAMPTTPDISPML